MTVSVVSLAFVCSAAETLPPQCGRGVMDQVPTAFHSLNLGGSISSGGCTASPTPALMRIECPDPLPRPIGPWPDPRWKKAIYPLLLKHRVQVPVPPGGGGGSGPVAHMPHVVCLLCATGTQRDQTEIPKAGGGGYCDSHTIALYHRISYTHIYRTPSHNHIISHNIAYFCLF